MIRISQKKDKVYTKNTVNIKDLTKLTNRQLDNLLYFSQSEKDRRSFEVIYQNAFQKKAINL